jgi:choline-sulfatase
MSELTRRQFLGIGAAGSAASLAKGRHSGGYRPGAARPKNVLLLMSDQHSPRALGYRNPTARTPNLDALARTGVRFDSAYCTNPVCVPSRASLLTGLYTHNHRAYNNLTPWPSEHKTMAHYFSQAGYITALIGKMHFVDAQTHGFNYHLDFNDWFQYLGPKTSLYADELAGPNSGAGMPEIDALWRDFRDPWAGTREKDNREGPVAVGRVSKLAEEDHFESFVTQESVRFLKKYGQRPPFFLISSFLKPHDPFMPAERFARLFQPEDMKLPDTWGKVNLSTVPQHIRESIEYNRPTPELRNPQQAKLRMSLYYANLAQMDDNVGKILSALREMNLEKDTIVVYTSDHGEMLGEHGLWQKFVFYEASVGVPLLFRVPGVTPANARSENPVSLIQVLPTLTELCGVPDSSELDGKGLVPDLRDPRRVMGRAVFAEYDVPTQRAKYMIRRGDYKYCYYQNDIDELYNLSRDIDEMQNLALLPDYRGKAEEMKAQLFEWYRPAMAG